MQNSFKFINLDRLKVLCKDEDNKYLKYLEQFSELIPLSIDKLEQCLLKGDSNKMLQEIHYMLPHVVFFGMDDFTHIMKKNSNPDEVPDKELNKDIHSALLNLKSAIIEVDQLIEQLNYNLPE